MDFGSAEAAWDDADVWGSPSNLRTGPSPSTAPSKLASTTSEQAFGQGGAPNQVSPGWGDGPASLEADLEGIDLGRSGPPLAGSPELVRPTALTPSAIPPLLSADFEDGGTSASGGGQQQMDDFGDSPTVPGEEDDDFGDFDEAGEGGDDDDFGGFDSAPPPVAPPLSIPQGPLNPLNLPPRPFTASDLAPLVDPLVPPLFPASAASASSLTDEPERQVGGLGQVMVTEELRALWKEMVQSGSTRRKGTDEEAMVEWKRSRIRRDFLVSLGVPVDLNDFLKPAKPLAKISLSLQTGVSSSSGPSSAPPASRSRNPSPSSRPSSRSGSIAPGKTGASPHIPFGREPTLDRDRCRTLLASSPSDLSLKELQTLRDDLMDVTAVASELLTHRLQVREQHVSDGETYNAMISDLISAAQKIKTTSSAVQRTGSTSSRWSSSRPSPPPLGSRALPGSSTPPRASSPANAGRNGPAAVTNGGRVISGSGALGASGDPRRFSVR